MRKINTRSFVRATRSTTREINRQILLNLVREHQPVSRAELARRMRVGAHEGREHRLAADDHVFAPVLDRGAIVAVEVCTEATDD